MVPDLDEARLRVVWRHQVQPLLEEYFTGQPQRAAGYDLEGLRHNSRAGKDRRRPRTADAAG
jgi:hypothetical protein